MEQVRSRDGTQIAYEKSGDGPPVVIVGGSLGDHHFYTPLAHELAKDFTVLTFDRRGRGRSGDTKPYAVEREVEDVAALVAEAGEPARVYGHSAGSMLALRAAAGGLSFARLLLADVPVRAHGDEDEAVRARQAELAGTIQAFHDRDDHRGAAAFFLSGVQGVPPELVDEILDSPGGEVMIDCARALPYDFALVGDGLVPEELAARVTVPTLILTAGGAPATANALVGIMKGATVQRMRSWTHDLQAAEIAEVVTPFFR